MQRQLGVAARHLPLLVDSAELRPRGVSVDGGQREPAALVDADAAGSKLGRIDEKRQVPGGDTQLTLHDGRTLLVEDASTYSGNDSVVVSNEGEEVVAHFTYEEGALVTAVQGAHAGRIGRIDEIQVTPGSSDNNVRIEDFEGDDDFETVEEYVVVIDENFVEGGDGASETEAESEADADDDADEGGGDDE